MSETKIGKYVIESLTRSMYEDSRCIYREYVQNAADQIDLARSMHLDENDYYSIQIEINREDRSIVIEDTATGVKRDEIYLLRDVACSRKQRGEQKGFRGIGRLGGLGYCSKLIFETSAKGEDVKTTMIWDASQMNKIVDDESDGREAGDVIDECVNYQYDKEDVDAHYFKVIMQEVSDDKLLEADKITDYLSMVAPVDYPSGFSKFGHQIKQYMASNNLTLDTYNIFVNGDQIYKGYTIRIRNTKEGDYDVRDIEFFDKRDERGNFIYWGWYSISELKGQIQAYNLPYGIRLRCKNIQVGNENTCRKFFPAEGDKRFAQFFYGELNIVSPELQPNAQRDYLREGELRSKFEKCVMKDFERLKDLCNDASNIRSANRKLNQAIEGQERLETKRKSGYLSQHDQEAAQKDYDRFEQERQKYTNQLARMGKKHEGTNSPLMFMFDNPPEQTQGNPIKTREQFDLFNTPVVQEKGTNAVKLRTDNDIYSRLSKKEKDLLNVVYEVISNTIAKEEEREIIIKKIEREITK
ncbi:MAG: ATP-binding protein [Bacteroidales bacterium]|nr:ATP-binding protein [Bacteroidales bacterium]